ncbi:MAG: PepSY domain-containing protein [Methylococcales bacterium]
MRKISVPATLSKTRGEGLSSVSGCRPFRKILLTAHRYLGLIAGFIFVVIGLTGSCNVFWKEVDEFLNPELVVKNVQGSYRSLDAIMRSVLEVYPKLTGSWMLGIPRHDTAVRWINRKVDSR